jgi:hypothetical protein
MKDEDSSCCLSYLFIYVYLLSIIYVYDIARFHASTA